MWWLIRVIMWFDFIVTMLFHVLFSSMMIIHHVVVGHDVTFTSMVVIICGFGFLYGWLFFQKGS